MAVSVAEGTERDADEATRFRVIDLDSHFIEPESMWPRYLPERFREVAPRHVTDSEGVRRLCVGGETLPPVVRVPGRRTLAGQPGGADPVARLEAMDAEGVEAMVMYPTTGLAFAALKDLESTVVLCRAFNDWAADFCAAAPRRLLAPALVPQADVRETLAETRRAVGELGLAGIFLRPNPVGRPVDDPAWEPLWSLLEEFDVPLGLHEGTGFPIPQLGSERSENFMFRHMMSHPFEHMLAMLQLIGAGVLDRHPTLRVTFVEAGCGWLPYWLERFEHHMREWSDVTIPLPLSPTEYFRRQCFVSADPEEHASVAAVVSSLGADNICWSTDYPHPDHEWRGMAAEFMARPELSDDAKRKILGENAARVYGL
jgi:predicted TIM-barrel fold metal-dependent hydrolase